MLFSEPLQLVFGASKVVQNVNIRFPSSFSRQTVKRKANRNARAVALRPRQREPAKGSRR